MPYFLYILPLHLIIIYTLLYIYIYISFYACIEYDSFSVNFREKAKGKNYLRTFSMAISNT